MNALAGDGSLVHASARDVLGEPRRIGRAIVVLLLVPLASSVIVFGVLIGTVLIGPMHTEFLAWDVYRTVSELSMTLAFVLALAVFAVLDALFVSSLTVDGGFAAGYQRVRENPRGVALWAGAFVIATWPFRFVVWPRWTFGWLVESLAVFNGDLSWLPVLATLRAVGMVVVLSAATLYLAPLVVVGCRGPKTALRRHAELVREIPAETATAALLGVGAVVVGFVAFGLGFLVLVVVLGLWIFGLFLLPLAIPVAALGFVCLATAYAFARTLAVRTYLLGEHRLSDDPVAGPTRTPAEPS